MANNQSLINVIKNRAKIGVRDYGSLGPTGLVSMAFKAFSVGPQPAVLQGTAGTVPEAHCTFEAHENAFISFKIRIQSAWVIFIFIPIKL